MKTIAIKRYIAKNAISHFNLEVKHKITLNIRSINCIYMKLLWWSEFFAYFFLRVKKAKNFPIYVFSLQYCCTITYPFTIHHSRIVLFLLFYYSTVHASYTSKLMYIFVVYNTLPNATGRRSIYRTIFLGIHIFVSYKFTSNIVQYTKLANVTLIPEYKIHISPLQLKCANFSPK